MTVHFAPARSIARSPLARAFARRTIARAANDNPDQAQARTHDQMLHAALRHFAEHGLGAAREARKQAENAFFTGDRESYDWWLGICRTLDRRMAEEMTRRQQG
jgi:protein-tyrosine-phosphatase